MKITYEHCGLYFVIEVDAGQKARLVHFSAKPYSGGEAPHKYYTLLELHCLGADTDDHHGARNTFTSPAAEMKYVSHRFTERGGTGCWRSSLRTAAWRRRCSMSFARAYPSSAAGTGW